LRDQRVLVDFADEAALATLRTQHLVPRNLPPRIASTFGVVAESQTFDEEAKEIQRLKDIIKNSPDLINAKDQNGWTPLHTAANKGQLAVASFLLENKAEVNAKDNSDSTPLHQATSRGHRAMVELLLAHGANVSAKENSNTTPLHYAAMKGYLSVAQALVAQGADVNARG